MSLMKRSVLSNNNLDLSFDSGCERTPPKNSGEKENNVKYKAPVLYIEDSENSDSDFVENDDVQVVPNSVVAAAQVVVAEYNDENKILTEKTSTQEEVSSPQPAGDEKAEQVLLTEKATAEVEETDSPPQPAPEERRRKTQRELVQEHHTQLLTLVRDHTTENNGQKTLTNEGWEIAKNYLNALRETLSFLKVVDMEDRFFVYLVEEIYGPNEPGKTRILQSFAKFPFDEPFTSMVRNLIGVYVNCEDIASESIHGAGKRSALLFLTKVLKADIITILETRGCNWKNPIFNNILDGYVLVRKYHSRGIAMLIRAGIKDSITIHSGYDGGCKHKESKIKTGDHEFICIDVMVQGLTYRILNFYHASKKTVECIENFRTLIEDPIRVDALVDSLVVVGDINMRPGDKLSNNTGLTTSYTEILDGKFRSNYSLHRVLPSNLPTYEIFDSINEKGTLTQPDLILSRRGRGEQLFHKPIHLFSMVKGFIDMNPEVDLYMSREEYAALRAEITKLFEPKPTWSSTDRLDTYQGQGNGHYVFLYELGNKVGQPYPFPSIFKRTVTTEGPCGTKCMLHKMFKYKLLSAHKIRPALPTLLFAVSFLEVGIMSFAFGYSMI